MEMQNKDKVLVDQDSYDRLQKGRHLSVCLFVGCMSVYLSVLVCLPVCLFVGSTCLRWMFIAVHVASEMAMDEIKSLSEKLETEQALRREAEHIAHQV